VVTTMSETVNGGGRPTVPGEGVQPCRPTGLACLKRHGPRPTFDELKRLQPALADLEALILRHAAKHKRAKYHCANAHWYGYGTGRGSDFKQRLLPLVGWEACCERDSVLKSCHAYDVAYEHLYQLLPDCRGGCACG
jgi:hypothetical protein